MDDAMADHGVAMGGFVGGRLGLTEPMRLATRTGRVKVQPEQSSNFSGFQNGPEGPYLYIGFEGAADRGRGSGA